MIIVRRFCYICDEVTKWTIKSTGAFWEQHTCKKCGMTQNTKTK